MIDLPLRTGYSTTPNNGSDRDMQPTEAQLVPKRASLLGVPLDIRKLIYDYLLVVPELDGGRRLLKNNSVTHFNILHVCRKLRDEAWHHFTHSNQWIHIIYRKSANGDHLLDLQNLPHLSLSAFPVDRTRDLVKSAALSMRLVRQETKDTASERIVGYNQGIFIFTKPVYFWFIYNLVAKLERSIFTLSIKLSPARQRSYHGLTENMLMPLAVLQNTAKVVFPDMMGIKFFQHLAATMKSFNIFKDTSAAIPNPNKRLEEIQEYMIAPKEEGNNLHKQGLNLAAATFYQLGLDAAHQAVYLTQDAGLSPYNPRLNSIMAINSDICNNFTMITNHLNNEHRYRNGDFKHFVLGTLEEAFGVNNYVLDWPGASQEQRRKAHLRRGVAAKHLAEYYSIRRNLLFARSHTTPNRNRHAKNIPLLLMQARNDFSLAMELAEDPASRAMAKQRYDDIRRDYDLNENVPPVQTIDVPGYGVWRGDPLSVINWTARRMQPLVGMTKRDLRVMTVDEIKEMKEDLGISGDRSDGLMRLLKARYAKAGIEHLPVEDLD
ncbi:hypothetical protein OHC33_005524 [Knufia fluminis]|uniref:Uncharacterized protein n=1 Tax=Knufia fluminis TaxID=191047 RepID=A0AAN8EQ51_9EURO|nr:hypothetical protein OHC33_005524 [Knufia fluminis]